MGGGGVIGRPAVPLTPPVPKEESKPAPLPEKPSDPAPARTPAVAADRPALPPLSGGRLELWAREAGRSAVDTRRSRRRVPAPKHV